jgi:hypothetical protein
LTGQKLPVSLERWETMAWRRKSGCSSTTSIGRHCSKRCGEGGGGKGGVGRDTRVGVCRRWREGDGEKWGARGGVVRQSIRHAPNNH